MIQNLNTEFTGSCKSTCANITSAHSFLPPDCHNLWKVEESVVHRTFAFASPSAWQSHTSLCFLAVGKVQEVKMQWERKMGQGDNFSDRDACYQHCQSDLSPGNPHSGRRERPQAARSNRGACMHTHTRTSNILIHPSICGIYSLMPRMWQVE